MKDDLIARGSESRLLLHTLSRPFVVELERGGLEENWGSLSKLQCSKEGLSFYCSSSGQLLAGSSVRFRRGEEIHLYKARRLTLTDRYEDHSESYCVCGPLLSPI